MRKNANMVLRWHNQSKKKQKTIYIIVTRTKDHWHHVWNENFTVLVFPKSDPFVGLPDGVLPIKARLASMDYEPVKDILRSSPGDRVQQQHGRLVHGGGRLAAGYDLGHHPRHLRQPHRPGQQVKVLGKRPSRFASCQFCQSVVCLNSFQSFP